MRVPETVFPELSEGKVHRQLQEPIAPDRLSDHAKVLRIRRGGRQDLCGVRETGKWIEADIQPKIAVRGIEIRMVENIEGVGLEFQGEALPQLEVLENREIKPRLEGSAEDVAARSSVGGIALAVRYDSLIA